jgi:hypothetical protein
MAAIRRTGRGEPMPKWLTGEWFIERTSAKRRRVLHYWATIVWLTVGLVAWVILTHIAGWAAETPVEAEVADAELGAAEAVGAAPGLVEAEPS